MASPALGTATGAAKLKAVSELVHNLTDDLDTVSLLPDERNKALEELKIYGRDAKNADPIFSEDGISMLLRHSFHSPSTETSQAALRVLANAMLLKPTTRQMFVDSGFTTKACTGLKSEGWDNEFLLSRIIFLLTYGTTVDLGNLIEEHCLADYVVENINRHTKLLSGKSKSASEPMEEMALVESLKLMFNVTYFCKEKAASFNPAIPHIVALLWKHDVPQQTPLGPPFGPLVHALMNLDLSADKSQSALYPKNEPYKVSERLIKLLDRSRASYRDDELESIVTPIVSLVGKVYENAPQDVKQKIQEVLLPTPKDREGILGRGDTISAWLLKNSTSPVAPQLREAISHLLFDMSDRDASKFVQNVGYGFASGFLFQNNVPVPASAAEAYSASDVTGSQKPVNPITGQFLDKERHIEQPPMTEAEKEREAERLFVLFERLKKTGIVDVQNPVEAAMRSGQIEELPDDVVEELD